MYVYICTYIYIYIYIQIYIYIYKLSAYIEYIAYIYIRMEYVAKCLLSRCYRNKGWGTGEPAKCFSKVYMATKFIAIGGHYGNWVVMEVPGALWVLMIPWLFPV